MRRKGKGQVHDRRTDKTEDPFLKIYEKIAEKTGYDVVLMDEDMEGINGEFVRGAGQIIFNTDSDARYATIFHEAIGEFSEAWNTEEMKAFQDDLLEWYLSEYGEERTDELISKYQKLYRTVNPEESYREAANEMVNDALAGLFRTEDGIRDFANWLYGNKTQAEAKSVLQKLADFIRTSYEKAVFMTASKLGEVVGVSESTTVRFAVCLGYSGYPELQKALEELVSNRLNSIQRMEMTYGRISQSEILMSVLQSDIEKIKLTMENIDQNAFEQAVDTILSARKIYIVGIRSCAPLANFLRVYLNLVCEDVVSVSTNSSSEIFGAAVPYRRGGCDYRNQFSALFHEDVEGTRICRKAEGENHHVDRQCTFSDEPVFLPAI